MWGAANDVIWKELSRDGRRDREGRKQRARAPGAGFEKNTNKHSIDSGNRQTILLS